MSVRGGDIVFYIKGNDTGYRYTINKIEKDAKKSGSKISKSFDDAFKGSTNSVKKHTQSAAKSIESSFSKVATKVGKMFLAAMSIKALANFTKEIINSGAAYEQAVGGIDALFGSSADKMKTYAMQAYRTAGISATKYMEQATSFSAKLLKETGGNTEKTADLINMAITDMSDNANRFGTDISSIQHAYEGLAKGNATMLDNLKIGYGGTKTELLSLVKDMGIVEKSVTSFNDISFSQAIMAIHEVQRQLGVTGTTAHESLTTWAGVMNMLKASFENFKATFGQGIINLLRPIFQVVANISDALTALGQRFLAWTQKIMGIKNAITGKKAQADNKATAGSLGGINDGIGNIGSGAKKAKKETQALKKELLGFDKITKLSGDKGTSQDTGTSAGSTSGGNISAGGVDFSGAESDVAGFTSTVNELLSKIKIPVALQEALSNLRSAFSHLFDIIANAGKWAWDNVLKPLGEWTIKEVAPRMVNILASAIEFICTVLETLGVILKPIWEHLIKPIAQALGGVLLDALDALKPALDYMNAGWKVLKSILELIWEPLIKPLCNFIADKFIDAIEGLGKVLKIVGDAFSVAAKGLESFAKWISEIPQKWATFKQNVKDFIFSIQWPTWDDIKNAAGIVWNRIKTAFQDKVQSINLKWPDWDTVKNAAGIVWNRVKTAFQNKVQNINFKWPTWETVKNAANTVWNRVKTAWKNKTLGISIDISAKMQNLKNWINSNFIGKINNKIPQTLKNWGFKIPYLAQGGYVKANTPQLAMIGDNKHQGEIVAPENKLQDMANKAAGNNDETNALLRQLITVVSSMNLNVELDGEKIKTNTVNRINNHTRATGQLEIII